MISTLEARARASPCFNLVKQGYLSARNLPDQMLHPWRHRQARHRIAQLEPMRILVVCHGNVCRSPYLEAVLRRALPNRRIASAGFLDLERGVPEVSVKISARRGLDLSGYRSRTVTPDLVGGADLVLVMDALQARRMTEQFGVPASRVVVTGDLDPRPPVTRGIVDPWGKPAAVFERSFDRLDRCASTLTRVLVPAR